MTPSLDMIVAVLVTLGARELLGVGFSHLLGRRKRDAETESIHLSNTGLGLADLREAMSLVANLRSQMEADKDTIAALKDSKIDDDRKIARRDGIIDEQRKELREVHEEVAELRIKLKECEIRIDSLERESRELMKENLQLKGMREQHD
jgi:hypothetical protein